jgi:hypothetical protein
VALYHCKSEGVIGLLSAWIVRIAMKGEQEKEMGSWVDMMMFG